MGAEVIFRAPRTRFVVMKRFRCDMSAVDRIAAAEKTLSISAARPHFAAAFALSVPHRLTGFLRSSAPLQASPKSQFRGTVQLKQSLAIYRSRARQLCRLLCRRSCTIHVSDYASAPSISADCPWRSWLPSGFAMCRLLCRHSCTIRSAISVFSAGPNHASNQQNVDAC